MSLFKTVGSVALAAGLFYSGVIYERFNDDTPLNSVEHAVDVVLHEHAANPEYVSRIIETYRGEQDD